jgi:nicotinate-nucleotide pyrophosphorylase (carboxylating)
MSAMSGKEELNFKNPVYEKAVKLYVLGAYFSDVGKGDITTGYFLSAAERRKEVTAEITVNEPGVLAGIQEAEWFLKKLGIRIMEHKEDSAKVKAGQKIMKIKGGADKILAAERTLLNLLQRMSGVASATNKLAARLPKEISLLATRKTLWGMLDKRAAALGGGGTHRLRLDDAVLIKDNHLSLAGDFKAGLLNVFKKAGKTKFIEIEFETEKGVRKFLEFYGGLKCRLSAVKVVVMLDNFKPDAIKRVLPEIKQMGLDVELSGGINEDNIKSYAIKGVSAVSSGAITMKAGALDMSLHII